MVPQTQQFSHPRVADPTDSRSFAADSVQMQRPRKRAATIVAGAASKSRRCADLDWVGADLAVRC
jgi:hypothetical protein